MRGILVAHDSCNNQKKGDDCDDDCNTDSGQMDGTITPAAFRCSKKVIHKKILLGEYVARRICLRYCKKLPYAGIIPVSYTHLFVLSLLVLGGLGYYVLGGYASEVNSIRKEADSLVRNSTEETFRRYRTSVVYAADGSVISKLNDQGASYYLKRDEIPQSVIDAVVCMEDQRFYQHRGCLLYTSLFHAQPLKKEVREVSRLFGEIPDTQVLLIAGNHDYLREKSYYLADLWPDNVTVFKKEMCIRDRGKRIK